MWRRQQHRDRPQHVVVDGLSHSTSPRHQSPVRPSRLQESKVRKVCYCIVLHAGALVSPAVLVKQGSSWLCLVPAVSNCCTWKPLLPRMSKRHLLIRGISNVFTASDSKTQGPGHFVYSLSLLAQCTHACPVKTGWRSTSQPGDTPDQVSQRRRFVSTK